MNSKIYAALGISDFKSYLFQYLLPILLVDMLILGAFLFAFSNGYLKVLGIFLAVAILFIAFYYPIMIVNNKTKNIEETLHYFITYAGALSTVNLGRKELFIDLSQKTRYKEISNIFKKLIYLVESIKVDFSTAAYKMANIVNTEHFARFLERMGISLSFTADSSKFLLDEQKALMNAYAVIYREGIDKIKVVQDLFVSLVLAFAFGLATILLLPFLSGGSSVFYLQIGLVGIVFLDVVGIVLGRTMIPKDKLYHDLGYEDERKAVVKYFFISLALTLVMVPLVIFISMPYMLKIAIILSPMMIVGIYSSKKERNVYKRDVLFPAFIRSLGDVHQSKGGTLTTTVETLLPHNFGILNPMVERVYKRLKITTDKFTSWYYFSKESGSALIAEFMDIFVSVVYRGGSSAIAGSIVSDNMSRINGLRQTKKEYVSTLRGNLYGSFFGLALTIYISLLISTLLITIFTSLTSGIEGQALDLLDSVFPTDQGDPVAEQQIATLYVAIILTVHAFFMSYFIKEVDGGNKFSMFKDVVILLWLGAVMEIGITALFKSMFSSYFGG